MTKKRAIEIRCGCCGETPKEGQSLDGWWTSIGSKTFTFCPKCTQISHQTQAEGRTETMH